MDWGSGREATIAELQRRVRESGSFIDRAIAREVKIASGLFAERHTAWAEVAELVGRWENGMGDLQVLEAIRWINRGASCWKAKPVTGAGGSGQAARSSADVSPG
jgi:hypothetical protein